ncbi:MAG: tol-pal system protein YbgF [Gammaproteobacteria bacterium]
MLFNNLSGSFLTHGLLLTGILFTGLLLSPEIFAANKSAPVTTPTSPETEQRLANIERLLQNKGLLDMLQQIELLQQEIANLRGEIEVNNHVLNQMKNRQRDLYTDVDRRLQAMEGRTIENQSSTTANPIVSNPPLETLGQSETVTPPESQAEAVALTLEQTESETDNQIQKADQKTEIPAATVTETDPVQIQAEYQQAFKLLKQSQYDQAIKAFRKFLQAHPDNQYSDNAQYWMAEALYVKRQYEDAIKEYNNLVSNYPDSQKVPHGLLKIGYSYQELGEADTAKLWYTDVRQRFPGTTASRLADDRLKNINDS